MVWAPSAHAATLTAALVYASDATGNIWNIGRWNTIGQSDPSGQPSVPQDPQNVYNLYWSTNLNPATPTFINGYNDARVNIAIDLTPGTHTWLLHGNSVGEAAVPTGQHFAINLYFGSLGQRGAPTAPGISGVVDSQGNLLHAPTTNNAMDLFGDGGQPAVQSLTWTDGATRVTLTSFSWLLSQQDIVWNNYHGIGEYPRSDNKRDYIGAVTLRVEQVPEPGLLALTAMALGAVAARRRKR